jgi:hypothetical protein
MTITVKTTLTTFFRATRTLAFSALAAATVFAIPAQQADAAVVPVTFSSTTWGYGIAGNVPSDLTAFTSTQIQGFGSLSVGAISGLEAASITLAAAVARPLTFRPHRAPMVLTIHQQELGLAALAPGSLHAFPPSKTPI